MVADVTRCRAALAELEVMRAGFTEIMRRADPQRRQALLALRRQLSDVMGRVQTACEPLFDGEYEHLLREFRDRFSRWRSATAFHQAQWPAVNIDKDPVAYSASAAAARDLETAFTAWMHQVCDAIETGKPLAS